MESLATSILSRLDLNQSREPSLRNSSPSPRRTRALLSIRPPYAEAIFQGEKRFEFRRAIFRRPVTVVVVYVTSPICLVAGEFDVVGIISDEVRRLWSRTGHSAGIEKELFFDYFSGCATAHAIEIGEVRRYARPLELASSFGVRPPQSFVYV